MKAYGSSELLIELNSIICRFTNEQRRFAQEAGFAAFAKPVQTVQFDRQFNI
jgi:hypothetical protein